MSILQPFEARLKSVSNLLLSASSFILDGMIALSNSFDIRRSQSSFLYRSIPHPFQLFPSFLHHVNITLSRALAQYYPWHPLLIYKTHPRPYSCLCFFWTFLNIFLEWCHCAPQVLFTLGCDQRREIATESLLTVACVLLMIHTPPVYHHGHSVWKDYIEEEMGFKSKWVVLVFLFTCLSSSYLGCSSWSVLVIMTAPLSVDTLIPSVYAAVVNARLRIILSAGAPPPSPPPPPAFPHDTLSLSSSYLSNIAQKKKSIVLVVLYSLFWTWL